MPVTLAHWEARRLRRERTQIWPSLNVFLHDLGIFSFGAVSVFSVGLVGQLPGTELILLPILPYLLIHHGERAFKKEYRWFYVLAAAWLFGTLVADFVNGTTTPSRLKGIARVVFFALDFMGLCILINKSPRAKIVLALSMVVGLYIPARNWGGIDTQWKYGIDGAVSIAAMLVCSYYYVRRRYMVCVAIFAVLAFLNLKYATRSQIAVDLVACLLTVPIFGVRADAKVPGGRQAAELVRMAILLMLAGGAAALANNMVKYAAAHDYFSEATEAKFNSQSEGKLGVLFGGRPEILVALQAIRDSPIVGHGSYPISDKYYQLLLDIQYRYGYSDVEDLDPSFMPVIPSHSHLLMGWVESGILGGVFWIYIFVLTLRAVFALTLQRPALTPLYCYLLVNFLWDILYSPLGMTGRLWGAFNVLLCFDILYPAATGTLKRLPQAKRLIGNRGVIGNKRFIGAPRPVGNQGWRA